VQTQTVSDTEEELQIPWYATDSNYRIASVFEGPVLHMCMDEKKNY